MAHTGPRSLARRFLKEQGCVVRGEIGHSKPRCAMKEAASVMGLLV